MDPLSASASVLTLLAIALNSCKFLYNFLLDVRDAPAEICAQRVRLQCISRTFLDLSGIYSTLLNHGADDALLKQHLSEFLVEIQNIENKLGVRDNGNELGRGQRFRERCRWILRDRRLRTFLSSLEQWDRIIRQAASAVQLRMLVDIKDDTSSILTHQARNAFQPHSHTEPCSNDRPHSSHPQHAEHGLGHFHAPAAKRMSNPLPHRLEKYLRSLCEPISFVVRQERQLTLGLFIFSMRGGSPRVRVWSKSGREAYRTLPGSKGYTVCFTVQSSRRPSYRTTIIVHGLYQWNPFPRLNIYTDLKVAALIEKDSPQWLALKTGDIDSLKHLFSMRHDAIFGAAPCGDTSLHIATRHNRIDTVRFLLDNGADIDAANDFGQTALHVALQESRNDEIPQLLLARGADSFRTDSCGRTPFHTFFNDAIRKILPQHKDDIDFESLDSQGLSILHYLCRSHQSLPSDLAWCDTTSPGKDNIGRSPLHIAVLRGNIQLSRHFLDRPDADELSKPDYLGRSLLHYAVRCRRVEIIDCLLAAGFDSDALDHKGRTVMHHAASEGCLNAVKKLVDMGVSRQLDMVDEEGYTPVQLAAACGATACVEYLLPLVQNQELEWAQRTKIHEGIAVATQRKHINKFIWIRSISLCLLIGMVFRSLYRLRRVAA